MRSKLADVGLRFDGPVLAMDTPARQPGKGQASHQEGIQIGVHTGAAAGRELLTNNRILVSSLQTMRPSVVRTSRRSKRPMGSNALSCEACCSSCDNSLTRRSRDLQPCS